MTTTYGFWQDRALDRHVILRTMKQIDRRKSLQQLDAENWGEPDFDSHLVTECHRLRRIPLQDLTIEDLRIMIGQDIGLEHLVPLALEHLQADPFAEGAYYPCDLLVNLLRSEAMYWQSHPALREQLVRIAERAIDLFPAKPELATKTVTSTVKRAFEDFRKNLR